MGKTIFSVVLILIISIKLLGCQEFDRKKKELEFKERELELRERELSQKEESLRKLNSTDKNTNETKINTQSNQHQPFNFYAESNLIKYVYMVFIVSTPKVVKMEFSSPSTLDPFGNNLFPEKKIFYGINHQEYIYTTEIQELRNYNEDIKFKYIDKMSENVLTRATVYSSDFDKLKDDDKKNYKAKIIDKKINVFNTYKDASIHRNISNSEL